MPFRLVRELEVDKAAIPLTTKKDDPPCAKWLDRCGDRGDLVRLYGGGGQGQRDVGRSYFRRLVRPSGDLSYLGSSGVSRDRGGAYEEAGQP